MSQIIINGNIHIGKSISVMNGKVIIDGKDMTPDSKVISISVEGDIGRLEVEYCNNLQVVGTVNAFSTSSSDVKIKGNVGDIQTSSGDVEIEGNVEGSIQTSSGDVECNNVAGSVSTRSGDIEYKK